MDEQVERDLQEIGIKLATIDVSLLAAMRSIFLECPDAAVMLEDRYRLMLQEISGNQENAAKVRKKPTR